LILNRVDELGQLRSRFDGGDAELLVVYGRRRIGKTELLTHLAADVRSLYIEATDSVPADQLRDLGTELARVSGRRVARQPAADQLVCRTRGDRPVRRAGSHARGARRVPTACQALARAGDRAQPVVAYNRPDTADHARPGRERAVVLRGRGPRGALYGRRTGQLRLEPFTARDAGLFQPEYSAEDRVQVFAVCGGVP
jgi:hypothetical protein